LAGYDFERLARALDRMRQIDRIAPRWLMAVAGRIVPPVRGELLTLARAGWSGFLRDRATHMTRVWTEAEKTRLWPPGSAMRPTTELIRSWYDAAPSSHPIDQMQQVYCHSWLVEDLLMKADKMSMAASLELRCPFLDHRLVEWAARLPMDWKVGNARVGYSSKRILREFARKRLPAAIVSRPKRGFPVPAYGWLAGKTGQWAESRLGQQGCLGRLFDTSTVAPVLSAARAGDTTAAHKIWTLLVLDQWIEAWT
jgi:asparagine synthase (glutamine-hydrolysing)